VGERTRANDASASTPVLVFFFLGLTWLLVATFFQFIASWKLQNPNVLADVQMLTYGRVVPAYNASFTYGGAAWPGWVWRSG
jgi:cbb3-type cytochrome oxidase subunit 1